MRFLAFLDARAGSREAEGNEGTARCRPRLSRQEQEGGTAGRVRGPRSTESSGSAVADCPKRLLRGEAAKTEPGKRRSQGRESELLVEGESRLVSHPCEVLSPGYAERLTWLRGDVLSLTRFECRFFWVESQG